MRYLMLIVLVLSMVFPAAAEDYVVMYPKKDDVYSQTPEGKAVVYIVRPTFLRGLKMFWTYADEEPIALTWGKTYTYAELDPGTYLFWTQEYGRAHACFDQCKGNCLGRSTDALELTVEAGKTYCIKQDLHIMGIRRGNFALSLGPVFGGYSVELSLATPEERDKAFRKCQYVRLTAAGTKRAKMIGRKYIDVAREKLEK